GPENHAAEGRRRLAGPVPTRAQARDDPVWANRVLLAWGVGTHAVRGRLARDAIRPPEAPGFHRARRRRVRFRSVPPTLAPGGNSRPRREADLPEHRRIASRGRHL